MAIAAKLSYSALFLAVYFAADLKRMLTLHLTGHEIVSNCVLIAGWLSLVSSQLKAAKPLLQFVWACFLAPLGAEADQRARLDKFYQSQAGVYDSTRKGLLRGRSTMLKLSVAHLLEQRRRQPGRKLVWVDIGGGTGWNIERMHELCSIDAFDAIYLIDLCEPLLEIARKRFEERGWRNVHVLCQDATRFEIPEWLGPSSSCEVDFITMSYSLSMIPNFYAAVDRIERCLASDGLLSVVDFYVSGRQRAVGAQLIGDLDRACSWFTRWFWLHWFEFDHVDLHPSRRGYLEHKFGTVKTFNGRNRFVLPWIVKIPYYIGLFTRRDRDVSAAVRSFAVESGNIISTPATSPALTASSTSSPFASVGKHSQLPELDDRPFSLGAAALQNPAPSEDGLLNGPSSEALRSASSRIEVSSPLSSFHYQLRKYYRLPFLETAVHKEFRTWIYGFTWEDPREDMKHLDLRQDDEVLAITSAGDNLLHYAIAAGPKRLHAVDMNPCQGNLLELKLAAVCALNYSDFWRMFGEGRHPDFRELLDLKLSPYLSAHSYQFWKVNADAFDRCFYMRGYSGLALRAVKWGLWLAGVSKHVDRMCDAETIEEQRRLWKKHIKPVMTSRWMMALVSHPIFMWNALGVPVNQAKMFLKETSALNYAMDTLDPVACNEHLSKGAYWYYLCLKQCYSPSSCPLYLTPEGFATLKRNSGALVDRFRLHTDSIVNVLRQLTPGALSAAVWMDHGDWIPNSLSSPSLLEGRSAAAKKPCELTESIRALKKALKLGGRVFWRSAAMDPWYKELFVREGFEVERIGVREIGCKKPIDGVNMYASFWKATKTQVCG